jgi:hypothetical protein
MNCLSKCGDLEVPPRPPLEGAEGGMSSDIKGKKQCIANVFFLIVKNKLEEIQLF